jgi:hypothetical protein
VIQGGRPPVEEPLALTGPQRFLAVEGTLEQFDGWTEAIVEVHRFALADGPLGAFVAIQPLRIDRPQRLNGLRPVLGLGGLAIALQVNPTEYQACRLGARAHLDSFACQLGRVLVLAKVIEPAGLGERIRRCHQRSRQHHDHQRGEKSHGH